MIAIAGGVTFNVCVPPVIVVRGVEKEFDVAFGVTVRIHVEPAGVIAEFEGIETE